MDKEEKELMEFEDSMLHYMFSDYDERVASGDDISGDDIFKGE